GENLNLTGLVVTGHFNNGSNRQLNPEEYTSTPTEETVLDSEGPQQITIAAKQDTTKTATFNVTVQKTDFEFTLDASGKSYTLTKSKKNI
ncbi:MAG: bacterial Ig-like domain-containing protein, partial [Mycoplasmoidaceae bacterium]|nr:bacterial Ig-like domain-containing protein [Mycoplasmoidaceae bacterium]